LKSLQTTGTDFTAHAVRQRFAFINYLMLQQNELDLKPEKQRDILHKLHPD